MQNAGVITPYVSPSTYVYKSLKAIASNNNSYPRLDELHCRFRSGVSRIYKANARTMPPSRVRPPVAALAIAPLAAGAVELAEGALLASVVKVLLLPEGVEVEVAAAATVLLAAADEAAHFVHTVLVTIAVDIGVGTEVVTAVTVEAEPSVVPELIADTEAVAEADAVADAVAEEDTKDTLELPPLMWNGKEYWKIAGLLSREILMPYVLNARLLGTDHVYEPVFFTPAMKLLVENHLKDGYKTY